MGDGNNLEQDKSSIKPEKKGIGWREVVGGTSAAALAAGITGSTDFAKSEVSEHLWKAMKEEGIAFKSIIKRDFKEFRAAARTAFIKDNPQPTNPEQMRAWFRQLHEVGRKAINDFWHNIAKDFAESHKISRGYLKDTAAYQAAGTLGKAVRTPIIAFKYGGNDIRVTMGLMGAASALLIGSLIHTLRSHSKKSDSFMETVKANREAPTSQAEMSRS